MSSVIETRKFTLPKGGEVEFDIMPGFYEKVRQQFKLDDGVRPSDEHLRMFLFGAVNDAIKKQSGDA